MNTRGEEAIILWKCDHGSALIEAAIVVPFLLVLVLGVVEFSYYFYQEQLITSGVRDAARFLASSHDPTVPGCIADAENLATTGSISGGPDRVAGWIANDMKVKIHTEADPVNSSTGFPKYNELGYPGVGPHIPIVTVSTEFTYVPLGFFGILGLKAPTISVSDQERWVGGAAQNSC